MSYPEFVAKVKGKFPASAILAIGHANGKHFARLVDGVKIVGNTTAKTVWVSWGSGHTAIATL